MDNKVTLPADLLWANRCESTDRFWTKAHSHGTYYHLQMVEKGNYHMSINDKIYDIKPTMISIAGPGDTHAILSVEPGTNIVYSEVKFIVYSNTLNKALSRLQKVFYADDMQAGLLKMIVESAMNSRDYANINAGRFHLMSFLYYTCDSAMNTAEQDSMSYHLRGIDTSDFSRATIDTVLYMEEHYMDEVTLEKVGAAIGYHKNYISTMVKKDLSIHANELLAFIRTQKAAVLLSRSDYSIQDICRQTGFKNVSHFSRLFKKMVGVPPVQYRKSYPGDIIALDEDRGDTSIPVWSNGLLRDYIELKNSK